MSLGGDIWLESTSFEGSTFVFSMRVYETSQICTNVLVSGPNHEEQKKVEKGYLMVDPENIEMQLEHQKQEKIVEFNGMTFSLENQAVKFCKFSEKSTTVL